MCEPKMHDGCCFEHISNICFGLLWEKIDKSTADLDLSRIFFIKKVGAGM